MQRVRCETLARSNLRRAAEEVWAYLRLVHEPAHADLILCLGSHDVAVAVRAAELWRMGWAPLLVISGGMAHRGDLAETGWSCAEAEVLAEVAEAHDVPRSAMLLEDRAANTGENFTLTRDLIAARNYPAPRTCLVVTKPYMTRRAFARVPAVLRGSP